MANNHWILTVTGEDHDGIIAEITGILFDLRFNLEDISMTILEGEFAMMVVFHESGSSKKMATLRARLEKCEARRRLNCFLKPVMAKLHRGDRQARGTVKYLITAIGRDRTGIVHQISQALAQQKLNITDLNSKILGYGSRCLYSMLLEVDIPLKFSMPKLEKILQKLRKSLKIEIQIKPVESIQL